MTRGLGKLNALLARRQFEVTRLTVANTVELLRSHGVRRVFDVGAASGAYAHSLRVQGYTGQIHSFEPLASAYQTLVERSRADNQWQIYNVALGEQDGTASINIAGNSDSSSLLPMLQRHREAAPEANYTGVETVRVRRLDSLVGSLGDEVPTFLKIDTQGSECSVLEGASDTLATIVGVQVELSLTPLYEGSPTWLEMIARLDDLGFSISDLIPGFRDQRTGQLLQCDGVFFRS